MRTIAKQLASFAHALRLEDVPDAARERAAHSILDGFGVALAASTNELSRPVSRALRQLGSSGDVSPVIGMALRLPLRDAAFLNGFLIHALDFDDTHLRSAVHPTASLLPTILAIGHARQSGGSDILAAYIAGLEVIARLGIYGGVPLREAGLHPTSVIGIFGCTLAAGKLLGLAPAELEMAQGIALSMASGRVGSPADGPSNKRLHPGSAAQSGITAALLAAGGLKGPDRPYEGERGLFRAVAKGDLADGLQRAIADLGTGWECGNVSVKPLPACHLTHACIDAAIELRRRHAFAIEDVSHVTALVPAGVIDAVCEPVALRRRPATSHAAQFSIPFVVAAGLVRARFSLAELTDETLHDPAILALADRVDYEADPETTYPRHRTGEIRVELRDGRTLRHREAINRGAPDRPLPLADITAKFRENASLAVPAPAAERLMSAVLDIGSGTGTPLRDIVRWGCSGSAS